MKTKYTQMLFLYKQKQVKGPVSNEIKIQGL